MVSNCRDLLEDLDSVLKNIRDISGIKKIVDPVQSLIIDPELSISPNVRADGASYALYVQSESLAKENGGHLQGCRTQLDKLTFTGNDLNVKADLNVSDIQIGAVELKDGTTDTRATVEADGSKYGVYVKSVSMLQESTFTGRLGEIATNPTANTLLAREKAINDTLVLIKDTSGIKKITDPIDISDKFTRQLGLAKIAKTDGTQFDPTTVATQATATAIQVGTDNLKISNAVSSSGYITFAQNSAAGTVGVKNNITQPGSLRKMYTISFLNPSTVTGVDVQLYLKETFTDSTSTQHVAWAKYGSNFTVAKSTDAANPDQTNKLSGVAQEVQGAMLAQGLGIGCKLIDGTGSGQNFDLMYVIREV